VQCTQNRLFESISWPQLGHLIIPGTILLFLDCFGAPT
jgi:ABC-type Fe3+ transport system permease subunit